MGGHTRRKWLKGSHSRLAQKRTSVRRLRYDELEATLDPYYFPAIFYGARDPTLRAIWRASATAHEREHEEDWATFERYAVALRLTIGIDSGGYAHTVRAPVEWDPGETERALARDGGDLGALENAQARAFIAERAAREEAEAWGVP